MEITNTTDSKIVFIFFWFNFGAILFFIIVWVVNISMWVLYIWKKITSIKGGIKLTKGSALASENVKNLTVQLWKFRLLLLISCCEIFALLVGGATIALHRILTFYKNDIKVEIAVSYFHDVLHLFCLYQIITVLKLLNMLIRYLRGVYNWHQYEPDGIKNELKYILIETLTLVIIIGLWITAIPLGVLLILRLGYEYLKHVKLSREMYKCLKGVSRDFNLVQTNEGQQIYRIKKREERKYKWFATWIIIGIFFWISATVITFLGLSLNQIRIFLELQQIDIHLIAVILSYKIYMISVTDVLICIGGTVLFPIHIWYTFKHFAKSNCRVDVACFKMSYAKSLREPLI